MPETHSLGRRSNPRRGRIFTNLRLFSTFLIALYKAAFFVFSLSVCEALPVF